MSSRPLLLVLIISLALRLAAVIALGDRDPSPDAVDDYLPMAAHLLQGHGYLNGEGQPDSVRGPGYSSLIAVVERLFPQAGVAAILWAQALLDALTTWLIGGMARRVMGPVAGLFAAALYALNPLAIYACLLVGPEILFAFLLSAALAAFMRGIDAGLLRVGEDRPWMVIAGMTMGAAVLTRATPMLLLPVWGLWVLVIFLWRTEMAANHWTRLSHGLRAAIVLGLSSACVAFPWTYRNWVVFHEFIPVVANGGVNFYSGSSERFWPPPPVHHQQRAQRREELIALGAVSADAPPQTPGAGDKYQYALGMANYRLAWQDDPAGLVSYLFRKSLRLWYATQSGRLERFVGMINVSYLLLAVVGFLAAFRAGQSAKLVPCLLTVAYFPLVLTAMFPLARYVVGFTPCLCVMAAGMTLLIRPTESSRPV